MITFFITMSTKHGKLLFANVVKQWTKTANMSYIIRGYVPKKTFRPKSTPTQKEIATGEAFFVAKLDHHIMNIKLVNYKEQSVITIAAMNKQSALELHNKKIIINGVEITLIFQNDDIFRVSIFDTKHRINAGNYVALLNALCDTGISCSYNQRKMHKFKHFDIINEFDTLPASIIQAMELSGKTTTQYALDDEETMFIRFQNLRDVKRAAEKYNLTLAPPALAEVVRNNNSTKNLMLEKQKMK